MIKRRQDGSTFMGMFSGFQSTSFSFQQPLVLVLNYSLCKNLLIALSPSVDFFFHFLYYSEFLYACAVQSSFLCLHWLVCFIHITEALYLLHWWSYMLSHLASLATLLLPSIFNLKGLIGYIWTPSIDWCSWFDCINLYNSYEMKLDDLYIYFLLGRLGTYC